MNDFEKFLRSKGWGKYGYVKMCDRHRREISGFPLFYAVNDEPFRIGLKNIGLAETDEDKLCCGPQNVFFMKTDATRLNEILFKHANERYLAIISDKTGKGHIRQMFEVELERHGYNPFLAFDAVGLSAEEVKNNPALLRGYKLAKKNLVKKIRRNHSPHRAKPRSGQHAA